MSRGRKDLTDSQFPVILFPVEIRRHGTVRFKRTRMFVGGRHFDGTKLYVTERPISGFYYHHASQIEFRILTESETENDWRSIPKYHNRPFFKSL